MTWTEMPDRSVPPLGPAGVIRALLRGLPLILVILVGLILLLVLRAGESLICGHGRPVTGHVPQLVSRLTLALMGLRVSVTGQPMVQKGGVVCNHGSWLDIFVLNAYQHIYFVSKAEVAGWPGIGWLARATGTVFIRRDKRDAQAQKSLFEARLSAGHRLLFFPEGTSSDGRQVLPFKPTLFAGFFAPELRESLWLQPVTLRYHAPEGEVTEFYGWWGDMEFAPHFLSVLGARRQGRVSLIFHAPLRLSEQADRKRLAAAAEAAVRQGFSQAGQEAR